MLLQRWRKEDALYGFSRFLAAGNGVKGRPSLTVSLLHKAFPGLLAGEEGFRVALGPSVAWPTLKVLFLNIVTTLRAPDAAYLYPILSH